MFTTIARAAKANRHRQAGALLLSCSLLALLVLPLARGAEQRVEGLASPPELFEVQLAAAPDVTPSLPAGSSAEPAGPAEPAAPAAPSGPPVPASPASDSSLAAADPTGPGPGSGPGSGSGPGTGTGTGTGTGIGPGPGTGGPRALSWSELRPRKRVEPTMPEAAKAMGLGEQLCTVRMEIDEAGLPYALDLDRCPRVFHANVREALMKWRFHPHREEGRAVRAAFTLRLRFVHR